MITYLYHLYQRIISTTPSYVSQAIFKLIPIVLILSFFDIFGLLLILPIIQIVLDSSIIFENKYLSFFYEKFSFDNEIIFSISLLSLIVLFFLVKSIITYFGTKRQANFIFRTAAELTSHQFELYLYKPFLYYSNKESGNLLRSIIEIPFNFANGILMPFVIIINELIIASIILLVITLYSPFLFLSVTIFVAPFFIIYALIHKRKLKDVSIERDKNHSEMFSRGNQAINGFREILLFNKVDYFKKGFTTSANKFSEAFGTLYLYNSYFPRIVEGLAVLSIFGVFVTSYFLDYNMKLIASFLAAFALAAYRLIPSINKIVLSYNNIKSSEFVFDHLERTQSIFGGISSNQSSIELEPGKQLEFEEKLEIKELSFSYGKDSDMVFNTANLSILKGECIGITGDSGSGKTTLINILLMLLDQSSGSILVDGQRLDQSNKGSWYKTIAYVPQNVIIISGSIIENITFGIPPNEVDHNRLSKVIEQSQLKEMVDNLAHGIETDIGEHGSKISGGQRQRIGIARALYHGATILIFDEATSSLDKQTEELITNAIQNLSSENYSIIIIAHRLESLKYCDSIYKIVKGDIEGPKTFDEIL